MPQELPIKVTPTFCPVCAVNSLSDSMTLIDKSIRPLDDFYRSQSALEANPAGSNFSKRVLISNIHAELIFLHSAVIESLHDFEAIMSVIRNTIEKLATLSFISKKEDRISKLSDIYRSSSFDIRDLIKAEQYDPRSLIKLWVSQNTYWTTSNINHRIRELGDQEIELAYAYTSRVVHGLNRDHLLHDDVDKIYIIMYLYIEVISLYNDVFKVSVNDVYNTSVDAQHSKFGDELASIWSTRQLFPSSLLKLTSFGVQYSNYPEVTKNFIHQHNTNFIRDIERHSFTCYVRDHQNHLKYQIS